jgi:LPXTG-motif cell wall-anchored protein
MRMKNPLAGFGRLATGLVLTGTLVLAGTGIAMAAAVNMVDDEFNPAQITVATGESVTFSNQGDRPHTATADDGSFDTGVVDPGGSAAVTFETAGTYAYYCQFHGGPGGDGMAGVITVTGTGGGGNGGNGDGGNNGGAGATETPPAEQTAPALPQTATPLPLIGGAGALLLVGGLWLGRRRAAR